MAGIIGYSRREEVGESTVIVFDHIPKCAGTTFDTWLANACGGARIHLHTHADCVGLLSRKSHDFKAVTGHLAWGAHHFLPARLRVAYVTFVRDPLRTAVSHYVYARNQLVGEYSKDINSYLLDYPRNYFTNLLGQGDLEAAKEKLFETYCVFGVVEHYQESIAVIADTLRLDPGSRTGEKANVSRRAAHHISESVRAVFMETQADDYALYAAAVTELHRRSASVERIPPVEQDPSVEGVSYTRTLPDVRAMLDDKEYGKALELMCTKHLDALPWNMLLFAGTLAWKMGDTRLAGELHEKMERSHPHMATDYHAGFLISVGEYDRAVALLEAELTLFDSQPSLPHDTKFFEAYVRLHCLLIKASWSVAPDRQEMSIARLAACCEVSEFAFLGLLNVLCEVGAYARAVAVHDAFAHVSRNNPALVYTVMITVCYQGGMFAEARAFCARLLAVAPHSSYAQRTLIVMDRRTGRFELDLKPGEDLALRLEGTTQAAALLREIAMHHYDRGNTEKAFEVVARMPALSQDSMLAMACRSHAVVDFQALFWEDLLVIRSGPNLVFDHVYTHVLGPRNQGFDAIGISPEAASGRYALLRRGYSFPGPRYLHSADFAHVSRQVRDRSYTDCLVIMSDFDYQSYSEILKLASSLAVRRVYLYSLSHLLSGEHVRTMLALQAQALREP